MRKKLMTSIMLLVISAAGLSACGSEKNEEPAAASSEISIKDGTAKLLSTAKQLRKAATAGDEAKAKELGPKLEEAWSAYEDGVKPKYPDIYEQVEKSLDPAIAAAEASPLNKDVLLKIDNELIQVLYDFSAKLIPEAEVKAGANDMLKTTGQLKKEIETGNEDKVKELGPKLEDAWKTFEDGVLPRNAELYEKIEANLNPEVAGSQKSPIDKQVLTQLNAGLTQALNELIQEVE